MTQTDLLQHEVYLTDRIDKCVLSLSLSLFPSPITHLRPFSLNSTSSRYSAVAEQRSPNRQSLPHLNCIAFLRPSRESVEAVKRELSGAGAGGSGEPKYGGYWLCTSSCSSLSTQKSQQEWIVDRVARWLSTDFSNILTKTQLEEMATSDEFEVVKEVEVRPTATIRSTSHPLICVSWRGPNCRNTLQTSCHIIRAWLR